MEVKEEVENDQLAEIHDKIALTPNQLAYPYDPVLKRSYSGRLSVSVPVSSQHLPKVLVDDRRMTFPSSFSRCLVVPATTHGSRPTLRSYKSRKMDRSPLRDLALRS